MRREGFETHAKVVSSAREIFADEKTYTLLPQWSKAGRDGDAPGPEYIGLILNLRRYGPAARDLKPAIGPPEKAP